MNITLLGNRVLIKTEAETKTESGLIVSESKEVSEFNSGVVVAVGPGKYLDGGDFQKTKLEVGDKVVFRYAAEVKVEGKSYMLATEDDVAMVLGSK